MKKAFGFLILWTGISLSMTAYGQNDYVFGVFRSSPIGAYGSKDLDNDRPGI